MIRHPNPFFPAKAGTQIHPKSRPFLAPHNLTIWAPAFAGETGKGGML